MHTIKDHAPLFLGYDLKKRLAKRNEEIDKDKQLLPRAEPLCTSRDRGRPPRDGRSPRGRTLPCSDPPPDELEPEWVWSTTDQGDQLYAKNKLPIISHLGPKQSVVSCVAELCWTPPLYLMKWLCQVPNLMLRCVWSPEWIGLLMIGPIYSCAT